MQFSESDTLINARPSRVWEVLTDKSNLTVWDSGITDLTGDLRHGGKIRIKPARGGARTLRLRVDLTPGVTLKWTLRGPLGLYQGVRTVIITSEGAKTHLKVPLTFTGPLHRVLARMLPETDSALQNYVAAVRHRAELIDRAIEAATPHRPAGIGQSPGKATLGLPPAAPLISGVSWSGSSKSGSLSSRER